MLTTMMSSKSSTTGDPFFSSVKLLALNEQGADESTSFIDQSTVGRTLTPTLTDWDAGVTNPNPTGLSSTAIFNDLGTSVISVADASDLRLGSSDFTIEVWFYTTNAGTQSIVSKLNTNNFEWQIILAAGSGVGFAASSNGTSLDIINNNTFIAASWLQNTWYHVEVDRSGSNWYGFLDGIQGSTISSAAAIFGGTSTLNMGLRADSGLFYVGNMSAARITRAARHTANFTRPALPLQTS